MHSLLELSQLVQGRDTCFKYFTPFLSVWLRIGQNKANRVTERGEKTLKWVFSLCLTQQLESPVEPTPTQLQQKALWQPLILPTPGLGPLLCLEETSLTCPACDPNAASQF